MTAMESVPTQRGGKQPSGSPLRQYLPLAIVALATVTVFVGFAPTFYLHTWFDNPAPPALIVAHGIVFSAWVVLLLVQSLLVRNAKIGIHRRLGIVGALLAAIMIPLGIAAAIHSGAHGVTAIRTPLSPLQFMIIPLGQIVLFGVLTAAAIYYRNRPATHKRLMIVATVNLIGPAIARIANNTLSIDNPPIVVAVAATFLVFACIVFDKATLGKVHPVFAIVGPLTILTFPARIAFSYTHTWLSFATWLVR